MMRRLITAALVGGGIAAACGAAARGQEAIGAVRMEDATVAGTMEVSGGEAILKGGVSIVARDHTAEVRLDRGGVVEVCATSSLHVTVGARSSGVPPLLLALDRGAIELRTVALPHDMVITPDLRFATRSRGALDLRMRVTSNGDTCVENRGDRAPTLDIVNQFGDDAYELHGGQHVLFEHGSLKEVVDAETSPCGCPQAPIRSLAERGTTTTPGAAAAPGRQVAQTEAQHPFPAAESQGLTSGAGTGARTQPGNSTQVSTTLSYVAPGPAGGEPGSAAGANNTGAATPAGAGRASPAAPAGAPAAPGGRTAAGVGGGSAAPASEPVGPQPARPAATPKGGGAARASGETTVAEAPPPPAPPGARDMAHSIGRFFKRMFGFGRGSGNGR